MNVEREEQIINKIYKLTNNYEEGKIANIDILNQELFKLFLEEHIKEYRENMFNLSKIDDLVEELDSVVKQIKNG